MAKAASPVAFRGKWRIRWIDAEGVRKSDVFDSYLEAEKELRRRQVEADEIRAGKRRPEPADHSFEDLANYWLEHRAPEKRSRKDDEYILARHLVPAFGAKKLREIQSTDIEDYKAARCHLSPQTVKNHLTLMSTMLRVAVEQINWLLTMPFIRKPQVNPDDDVDQPWLKSDVEIHRLLEAARSRIEPEIPLSEVPFVLYSTAVYTGLREGELAGLRWSDIHFEQRTIHVRRSYDGKTKTRASRRHVPILDVLLPLLRAWKLRCPKFDDDLVFPNQVGTMFGKNSRIFHEVLYKCLDIAGFVRPADGYNVHVIHFHSLRHTFACHWRLKGGSLEDLVRVLGHTSKTMTEYYANIGGYHKPAHFELFNQMAQPKYLAK